MNTSSEKKTAMHYGIAERGKLYSLDKNYSEALRHYREALRLCVGVKGADIFCQHYSQCIMEALELSGAYDEVISYCEKTRELIEEKVGTSDFVTNYYASLLEKEGIQYLFKDDSKNAIYSFKEAFKLVHPGDLPLSCKLLDWAQRGYKITTSQIVDTQKRHNYFTVREDNVNPSVAIDIPISAIPF